MSRNVCAPARPGRRSRLVRLLAAVRRRVLVAAGLLPVAFGCGASTPTPIDVAEAACHTRAASLIGSGACDSFETLEDCPAWHIEVAVCASTLAAAARAERNPAP